MTHIEAMKQWLEVLEEAVHYTSAPVWSPSMTKECNEAITSLRQAIAEAEKQEPVAWTIDSLEQEIYENTREFVSFNVMEWLLNRLNTTPQQRTWVGLTDEEENALLPDPDGSAEVNVRHVEVLPGAWGAEFEEVDAWSKTLVLQMLHNHEVKLKQKNGYAEEKNNV